MSLKLGGSKKTYSNQSTTTSNSTTTPTVPEWASNLTQRVAGGIDRTLDLDPQNLVAPTHALQSQAAAGASNLGQWAPPQGAGLPSGPDDTSWLSPYMTADTPFASGGKAYDYVNQYLNPYLKDVVDSSAADFDANAGQVRAQQALDLAGSGAFGGSGAALTQSMTEGELSRSRANTLSGLRSHAYDTALGAAGGDAERATQARIANAQIKLQDQGQKAGFGFQSQQQQLAADANRRADISTQAGLGEALRGIDQQQRQAPITQAQQVTALLSGLPINLFTGQQTSATSNEASSGREKSKSWEFGISPEDAAKSLITAGAGG